MTQRPPKIFGAYPIREKCGECDQRAIGVAVYPENASTIAIAWTCDDHAEDLALFLVGQGIDHERHLFEILRTCIATEDNGRPCGAAGDFIVIKLGGESIMTICRRHLEEWRPETEGPKLDI